MRKVATKLHRDSDKKEYEVVTYKFGERDDLQIKVRYKVWPNGGKSIEYFSVSRFGRASQLWTTDEMYDLFSNFKNIAIGGES